jgi:hypothetical protein
MASHCPNEKSPKKARYAGLTILAVERLDGGEKWIEEGRVLFGIEHGFRERHPGRRHPLGTISV